MDELSALVSLEQIGLKKLVSSAIKNHLSVNEADLSKLTDYIIHQRLEAKSYDDFQAKTGLPPTLAASLDRLIRTQHPQFKKEAEEKSKSREDAGRAIKRNF